MGLAMQKCKVQSSNSYKSSKVSREASASNASYASACTSDNGFATSTCTYFTGDSKVLTDAGKSSSLSSILCKFIIVSLLRPSIMVKPPPPPSSMG